MLLYFFLPDLLLLLMHLYWFLPQLSYSFCFLYVNNMCDVWRFMRTSLWVIISTVVSSKWPFLPYWMFYCTGIHFGEDYSVIRALTVGFPPPLLAQPPSASSHTLGKALSSLCQWLAVPPARTIVPICLGVEKMKWAIRCGLKALESSASMLAFLIAIFSPFPLSTLPPSLSPVSLPLPPSFPG